MSITIEHIRSIIMPGQLWLGCNSVGDGMTVIVTHVDREKGYCRGHCWFSSGAVSYGPCEFATMVDCNFEMVSDGYD